MRTIEQTSRFKRDFKREAKGSHRQTLQNDFVSVVTALANDQALSEKHRDHGGVERSSGLSHQTLSCVDLSQTG